MKRKLFSALLALAMMATLALPAFASTTSSGDMIYQGTTHTPTVVVTMPTSYSLTLNPYAMAVTVGSSSVNDQVISPVSYITNNTTSAMKVGVKATATPDAAGAATLSAKPCTGKETTKSVFLMAELGVGDDSSTEPTWIIDKALTAEKINEKCYPQIIPTADGKQNAAILSVDTASAADANYIFVKVTGNLAANPSESWTGNDKVTLTLEFTFTPGKANTVTVASSSGIKSSASTEGAVMGTVVRLTPSSTTAGATINQPVVTDAAGNNVTVTKVSDALYYFTMPASAVTVAPAS